MEQVRPRWRRNALAVVALVAAVAALAYAAPIILGVYKWVSLGSTAYHDQPFDREQWLSYKKNSDPRIRAHMYDDLRRNHLKIGMTRKEALKLLGEPVLDQSTTLYYDIGPDPIGMDYRQLVIEFDQSDRIKRVYWIET